MGTGNGQVFFLVTRSRFAAAALLLGLPVLTLVVPVAVIAQTTDAGLVVTSRTDWLSGRLRMEVRAPLPSDGRNAPAASYAVEQEVRADLPAILQQETGSVRVDSLLTLAEHYGERPRLAVQVADLSENLVPLENRQTPDLRFVELSYSLDMYGAIAPLFIEHDRPADLPRVISWRPSREFTGLVIYARGELPVHGEDRVSRVYPAMFPDIYSHEATQVVLETDTVRPEVITSRGPVAYATSASDPVIAERAGTRPMRALAVGVFGRYATDPIISAADAEVFFAEAANRELIHDGRVVIIIEESVLD